MSTKAWNRKKGKRAGRSVNTRCSREKILILCEGEETEPNYFNSFPLDEEKVEVTSIGKGYNSESLVREAIRIKKTAAKKGIQYNQVWCVFDRDDFSKQQINNAHQLGRENKIEIAFSNEAFELWYVLHFNYHNSVSTRHDYCRILNDILKNELGSRKYKKNDKEIYSLLSERQSIAIKNAKRLRSEFAQLGPYDSNPSTSVFRLVEKLNEYL